MRKTTVTHFQPFVVITYTNLKTNPNVYNTTDEKTLQTCRLNVKVEHSIHPTLPGNRNSLLNVLNSKGENDNGLMQNHQLPIYNNNGFF
jgi:H2-forming N5,N10-methylenetetrahydromethanopterin dehydrogenase-like enzyme